VNVRVRKDMLRKEHPAKQGLRLTTPLSDILMNSSPKGTSSKTRIKTQAIP